MKKQAKCGGGLITRLNRHRRRGACVCLMALAAASGGCYGRFPMTHALYELNGDVDNKIVRNVVFWLLVWFPIYWFAQVGDAVIFNLIEFWTGAGLDLSSVSTQGDTTVTLQSSEDRNTLFMTISKKGEKEITIRFLRIDEGNYEMRDERNRLAGRIMRTPEGNLNLTDARGRTLRTINAVDIAAASAN